MKLNVLIIVSLSLLSGLVQAGVGYSVQAGDILLISVWKEPDLQREVLVRPDHAFSFPLAGEIVTKDKSISDITDELTKRLEKYIPEPNVTVSLRQIQGSKIYVIGKVNRPGEFLLDTPTDVMQVLSKAGGTATFANLGKIRILRRTGDEQVAIGFDYTEVQSGKKLEQNILLQSGDIVVVP